MFASLFAAYEGLSDRMQRYLDGLSIPEMARELGRSRHATEALVVRARAAFRRAYEGEEDR